MKFLVALLAASIAVCAAMPRSQQVLQPIRLQKAATGKIVAATLSSVPVLHQPTINLGNYYNAKTKQVVDPGFSIFTSEQLNQVNRSNVGDNSFTVHSARTYTDRLSTLDVSGSISIDLKEFQLSGGASFLRHKDASTYEARAQLVYKANNFYEQLPSDVLANPGNLGSYDKVKDRATHVIVALTYGTQNVFDFSYATQNSTDKQTVDGNIKATVTAIHSSLAGNATVSSNTTKAAAQFSCNYAGDVSLDDPPLTMADAIASMKQVAVDAKTAAASVPITAYLVEIKDFISGANYILHEIEDDVLHEIQTRMETYETLSATSGDVLVQRSYNGFSVLKANIDTFNSGVEAQSVEFDKSVVGVLQKFRANQSALSDLTNLLVCDGSISSLCPANLQTYIDDRKDESAELQGTLAFGDGNLFKTTDQLLGITTNPNIDFVIGVKLNLYCGSDALMNCLESNCKTPNIVPSTWINAPVASDFKNWTQTLEGLYNLNMGNNTTPDPAQADRIAFIFYEDMPCTGGPSVSIELWAYEEHITGVSNKLTTVGSTYPHLQTSGSSCPDFISWPAIPPPNDITTISYTIKQCSLDGTKCFKSTTSSTTAFPNKQLLATGSASTIMVTVQPICNVIASSSEKPLQLYCGPAMTLPVTIPVEAAAEHQRMRTECPYGDCTYKSVESLRAQGLPVAESCDEHASLGQREDGWYWVQDVPSGRAVRHLCEFDSAGGWTVMQNNDKDTPPGAFSKEWSDYQQGFSHGTGLWIGNDVLYQLTLRTPKQLQVNMTDCAGRQASETYGGVQIGCGLESYTLSLGTFGSGTAGDALITGNQDNVKFSTIDKDNDGIAGNCAANNGGGGFWYSSCGAALPNNFYTGCVNTPTATYWKTFATSPLTAIKMKLK